MARRTYGRRRGRRLMSGPLGMAGSALARKAVATAVKRSIAKTTARSAPGTVARSGGRGVGRSFAKRSAYVAAASGAGGAGLYGAYQMARTAGVKRQRVDEIKARIGSEFQVVKRNYGRKKPVGVKKLRTMGTQWRILRWQNIRPIDRGEDGGAMILYSGAHEGSSINSTVYTNTLVAANARSPLIDANLANTGYMNIPVNIYCLNSTAEIGNDVTENPIGFQPFINLNTGGVVFTGLYQARTDFGGVDGYRDWRHERGYVPSLSAQKRHIQNEWYDIRLTLRKPPTQTTWYDIMVVQFKEEALDPLTSGTTDEPAEEIRKTFWQGIGRVNQTHPMVGDPGYSKAMSHVRVLRRMRVKFDAPLSSTIEADTSQNYKVIKMLIRDGTMNSYQWGPRPIIGDDLAADVADTANHYRDPNIWAPEYAARKNMTVPYWKARKWLIISAFDPTLAATGATGEATSVATDGSGNPSYDILIRKKEMFATD